MIVRDEERSIARAIESALPHVDEVVVVDTGSRDATVAIVEQLGAQVRHMAWNDDFAAARNAAIEAADADFTLVLDADEWIISPGRLREWIAENAAKNVAGLASVTSSTKSDGTPVLSTIEQIRLLPRLSRYVGAIHESPTGYTAASVVPGLELQHDGYEASQVTRKRGRNLSILMRALEREPSSPYLHFQIGREHQIVENWYAAADAYRFSRHHLAGHQRWQPELIARSLYVLTRLGQLDEALAVARTELGAGTDSAEALFAIGNLCLDIAIKRPREHERWIGLARSCWEACLKLGEDRGRYDTTEGVGSYLAARNLAGLAEAGGDVLAARHWRRVEQELLSDR